MSNVKGGLIGWFAANPVAANLLMILVILLGVMQSTELRKEAFPSIEPDSINISISYDSGSASQSEEGLAIKIEEQLQDVTGIDTITSVSTGSGASITVEKQSDYDLDLLLSDVKTKIDAISTFPTDAKEPVIERATREEHAIWLQLYGDADRHTLQSLADRLKKDLLAKGDINRVTISGWLDPMMAIEIDEGRLQAYGLSLSDVETVINANSSDTMTAVMKNASVYVQLKASEQAYLKQDFADIPLKMTQSGQLLRLGDVAEIKDSFDDQTATLSRFQGQDSLAVQVITAGKGDITKTAEDAIDVMNEWQQSGVLPHGVQLMSWSDRSNDIKSRLSLLEKNAFTGIVLVFILLALFLNLTVAFWVAAGLPFIFFGTLFLMGDMFFGLTLNEFTTFGFILALGIVVDDAVVVGESVYQEREKHGDTLVNTIKGTLNVAVPTLFGVLTTVAAFAAISNVEGRLGEIYSQFAAVISVCLLLSVVESKLILPSHLAHLKTQRRINPFFVARGWQFLQGSVSNGMNWFNYKVYSRVIDFALKQRYAMTVLFLALLLFVMAMPFSGMVRFSFFPPIPGETVKASVVMQNDASFGQTHRNLLVIEQLAYETDKALRHYEEGDDAIAHIQIMSTSDHNGSVTVELKPGSPYNLDDFTRVWQQQIGSLEGARTINVRSRRAPLDDFRIELRANDDEMLGLAGNDVYQALQRYPAVSGIEDNLEPGQPQLHLRLNQQGRAMGMTTNELAIQVLQAFSGQVVQRYQRDSDEIEVKVRYPDAQREQIADVINAKVRTPDGMIVPVSTVATVTTGYTRDSITRIDNKRAVYLTANVDKDVMSSNELVSELQTTLVDRLENNHPGLDVHFAGEAEEQAETQSSMIKLLIVALLVIYILLAVPLKSYIQPVLIMTAIPFGVVGAILGHWINDLSLGILSFHGIIALTGVVVNDSLLLVARFNEIKRTASSIRAAIHETCQSRLRAVLITSFTTFAGLVPLLGETSHQAQFLIPAAVSLGYGIMFATVITLILIPCLLMIQIDVATLLSKGKRRLSSGAIE